MEVFSSIDRQQIQRVPNVYAMLDTEVIAYQTLFPELESNDYNRLFNLVTSEAIFQALSQLKTAEERSQLANVLKDYLFHLDNPPQPINRDPLFSLPEQSFDILNFSPEQVRDLNQNITLPPIIGINGVSCSGKDAAVEVAKVALEQKGYRVLDISFSNCILGQVNYDLEYYPPGSSEYNKALEVQDGYTKGVPVDSDYTLRAVHQQVKLSLTDLTALGNANLDSMSNPPKTVVILIGGPRYGDQLAGFYPGFLHQKNRRVCPDINHMIVSGEASKDVSFANRLPLDGMASLKIDWQEAIARMIKRVIATVSREGWSGLRSDDRNPEAYLKRWATYGYNTRPMLHAINQSIGVEPQIIDANQSLDNVARQLEAYILEVEARHKREQL